MEPEIESTVEDQLKAAIRRRPVANGLAIIVANMGSMRRDLQPLPGVTRDLDAMRYSLDFLKFATLPILNASKEEIEHAIRAAVGMKYPLSYRRFVFVFSGHGEQGFIHSHTGFLSLFENVFQPLIPINAPESELTVRDMPKIFLVDACRGDWQDAGVSINAAEIASRGSSKVTSCGNYLLACSTQHHMQSFETPDGGGFWMQLVAERLRTDNRSILDVLTALNREVNDRILQSHSSADSPVRMQQPILESSLNDVVNLLEESRQLYVPLPQEGQPVLYRCLPTLMQQPTALYSQLIPHRGVTAATHLSSQKKNRPKLAAVFSDSSVTTPQPLRLGSPSLSSAKLLGMPSPGTFPPAADTASLQIKQQPSSVQLALNTGVQSTTKVKEEQQRLGYFKAQLNHYQQRGIIRNYDYSDEEQYRDKQPHFSSCVTVTLSSGEVIQGSSGDSHPNKQVAREQAAKDAVRKIESKGNLSLTASSLSRQPSTTITLGYYRDKLNHYQQKGYIRNLTYTEEQMSHQPPLFKSCLTVVLSSNGKEIKGYSEKFCLSKQEARELAAKDTYEKIAPALGQLQIGGTAPTLNHPPPPPPPPPPAAAAAATAAAATVATIGASLPPSLTSSAKTSKSKLKEYFDQKALPGPPQYRRTQVEDGFRAEVKLPDSRGGWVSGGVRSNIKEAEHDAARVALQRLKL